MRRDLVVFLLVVLILLGVGFHQVSTLVSLLFERSSREDIDPSTLPPINSTVTTPFLIPKIIHQTYINTSIPARWVEAQKSCIDLHPDYEYMFWTDAASRDFIAKEFAWFLPTFDGYPHPIQRADAIRYFVLVHYGGVYIDLDDGCRRRLDPLMQYPAWAHRTIPTGISNDAIGAVPQHPFFLRVIALLPHYNRSWLLPYITIMGSTGPLFLSVVWKNYKNAHAAAAADWPGRVMILMPAEYNKAPWSFFVEYKGNSWHGGDARFIFWLGKHWLFVTVLNCAVGFTILFGVWWACRRASGVLGRAGGAPRPPPPASLPSRRGKRLPRWPWWGAQPAYAYELVEQHDA